MNASVCGIVAQVIPVLLLVLVLQGGALHRALRSERSPRWRVSLQILSSILVVWWVIAEVMVLIGASRQDGLADALFAGAVAWGALVGLLFMVLVDALWHIWEDFAK